MDVRVKVIPRSSKSEIGEALADGTLKVKVAAPAEKGRANEELCRLLAEHHGVPKRAVRVIAGHTSARKLVRISS